MRKYRRGIESEGSESNSNRDSNPDMNRRDWLKAVIGAGAIAVGVGLNDCFNSDYKISPRLLQYFQRTDENRWMNCRTESDEDLEIRIQILDDAIKESRKRKFTPISKPQDFDKMRRNPYGYWELANDVDLKGIDFGPIGSFEQPFRGIFNGNGHVIRNLKIKMLFTSISYNGLFGSTETGSIVYDLNLENPEIIGGCSIGSMIGVNYGALKNCNIEGGELKAYIGNDIFSDIGGIAGRNYLSTDYFIEDFSGIIKDCSISCISLVNSTRIGGFVGYNNRGSLINSRFKGNIVGMGSQEIGALIGCNHDGGYIVNPYVECHFNEKLYKRLVGAEEYTENNLIKYYEKKMIGG